MEELIAKAEHIKSTATTHFQSHDFFTAASVFSEAADLLPLTSLPSDPETLTKYKSLACACASNASQCYLKLNQYEDAKNSAERAIMVYEYIDAGGQGGVSFNVNKARFRLSSALISMCEGDITDIDSSALMDEAQSHLKIVLKNEPDNLQALDLARRGLEVARKYREKLSHDTASSDCFDGVGVVDGSEGSSDEEKQILAAINGGGATGGNGGWSMTPGWIEAQESSPVAVKTPSNPTFDDILKNISEKTNGMGVNDLVKGGLSEGFGDSQSGKSAKNSATVSKAWGDLENGTKVEEQEFSNVRSQISAAAAVNLKTTENNYSSGWRATHARRRYKGKETEFEKTIGAGGAWEQLNVEEKAAVHLVERTEGTKKILAQQEDGRLRGEITKKKDLDENVEVAAWRNTLKQRRRAGEEIKISKKKSQSAFSSLMGMEDEEIEKASKLLEERKEAERLAVKKKKNLAKKRQQDKIKQELGIF